MNGQLDQVDAAVTRSENKTIRSIALYVAPLLVAGAGAWGTWVTTRLFAIESAMQRHATASQLHESENRILERLDRDGRDLTQRLGALPSGDWKDRVRTLEEGQKKIENGIARIEALLEVVREEQKRKGM